MEMEPWLQTLLTILGTILASSGFWAYIQERSKRKAAENKHNNLETQMLIGLAHDRIIYLGMAYIERGYITQDEYENLYEYLYKPYEKLGGNGSAKRIMTEVDQLAIHKSTYNAFTYPRTDSQFITEDMESTARQVIGIVSRKLPLFQRITHEPDIGRDVYKRQSVCRIRSGTV